MQPYLGFNCNNGNLLSQTITAPGMGSVTQHYRYDQLNRLSIASEGVAPLGSAPNFSCSGSSAWCQTYHYDRYGNRGMQGTVPAPALAPLCASSAGPGCNSSTTALTPAYTTTSNRLNETWAGYDDAGNMEAFKDPIGSGTRDWSAAYDAENKQTYFCGGTTATCNSSNETAEYVYDGEGNRVQKLTAGVTETYVYDAFGRLAAEYTTSTPNVDPGSYWRTTDHLGSTRLVTTGAGAVDDRRDLFPFGEQIADSYSSRSSAGNYNESDPASRHLFTAKERDQESGLDYFLARYYSGSLGRFTGPDEPFADQFESSPQSWNLYTYVRNNPLRMIDPSGRKCIKTDDGGEADDGLPGAACASDESAPDVIEVKGKAGSLAPAIGLNLFFALNNVASASFAPIFDQTPRSLQQIPLNRGVIGTAAAGTAFAVEALVGPPSNKIRITKSGLRHAIARHTFYGPVKKSKSIFNLGESLVDLVKIADGVPPVAQAGPNFERVVNAGRVIGTDVTTGQPTAIYTVITDPLGNLVTMFPGRPR